MARTRAGATRARASRDETDPRKPGKFSRDEASLSAISPCALTRRGKVRFDLLEHALDFSLHDRKLAGIARAHDNVCIWTVLFVDERIAADDRRRVCLGNGTELGA